MNGPVVFLGGMWMPLNASRNFKSELVPVPPGKSVTLTPKQHTELLVNHGVSPEEAEKNTRELVGS